MKKWNILVSIICLAIVSLVFIPNGGFAYADTSVVESVTIKENTLDATEDVFEEINIYDYVSEGVVQEIYLVDNLTSKTSISTAKTYTFDADDESYNLDTMVVNIPNTNITHTGSFPFGSLAEIEIDETVIICYTQVGVDDGNQAVIWFALDQDYEGSITFYVAVKFAADDIKYITINYIVTKAEDFDDVTAELVQSNTSGAPALSNVDGEYQIHMSRSVLRDTPRADLDELMLSYVRMHLNGYAAYGLDDYDYDEETIVPVSDTNPTISSSYNYHASSVVVNYDFLYSYIARDTDGYRTYVSGEYVINTIPSMSMRIIVDDDVNSISLSLTDSHGVELSSYDYGELEYKQTLTIYFVAKSQGNTLSTSDVDFEIESDWISQRVFGSAGDNVYSYTLTFYPTMNNSPITFTLKATASEYSDTPAKDSLQATVTYLRPAPTITYTEDVQNVFNKNSTTDVFDVYLVDLSAQAIDADNHFITVQYFIVKDGVDIAYEDWIDPEGDDPYQVGDTGIYTLKIYTIDTYALESYELVTFTVANNGPTITTNLAFSKNNYAYNETASSYFMGEDPDGDAVVYHVQADSDAVNLSTETVEDRCNVSIVNKPKFSGDVVITYWVSDGILESDHRTVTIHFNAYIDVTQPELELTEYEISVNKNVEISLIDYVSALSDDNPMLDLSDSDVTYAFDESVAGDHATINDGVLKIFMSGTYQVKFALSDGRYTTYKTLVVTATNGAPTTADINTTQSYTEPQKVVLSGEDPDSDELVINMVDRKIYDKDGNQLGGSLTINNVTNEVTLTLSDDKYIGVVHFTFEAWDNEGARSNISNCYINIIDDVAPIVTRDDTLPTSFIIGTQNIDLTKYFTAVDYIDGVVDPVISGTVDTSTAGTYRVVYVYRDKSGNVTPVDDTTVVFTVTPNEKPVIELVTDRYVIRKGEAFDIYGFIYQIYDTEDGVITVGFEDLDRLTISDNVTDTSIPGTYVISLVYEDSNGTLSDIVQFKLEIARPASYTLVITLSIAGVVLVIGGVFLIRFIHFKRISKI